MCCRKDNKLTTAYRKRGKPIPGWKVYRREERTRELVSRHSDLAGGRVQQAGVVQSNIRSTRGVDERSRNGKEGYVHKGIHAYTKRASALKHIGQYFSVSKYVIVPVLIEPKDVRAVGPVVMNDTHNDAELGIEIVATKVRITPRAFANATRRCKRKTG